MKSFGTFLILSVVLFALVVEFAAAACDCDYHAGGCRISKAPAEGYKCKCSSKGTFACYAFDLKCDPEEDCPANCTSKKCCMVGGGDCGGY